MSKLTELLCPNRCDAVLTYARNKSVIFCFDDDEDITPAVHAVRCPVCGYLDVSTEPEYLVKLYSNENPVLDPEVTTQLVEVLEEVEWAEGENGDHFCPYCGGERIINSETPAKVRHSKNCKLAAALAAAKGVS